MICSKCKLGCFECDKDKCITCEANFTVLKRQNLPATDCPCVSGFIEPDPSATDATCLGCHFSCDKCSVVNDAN